MRAFADLYTRLDQTTKTNVKVSALADYFREVPDDDKIWTIALLSHRRPKRSVKTSLLREWAAELGKIPLWLFEESYHVVGDLAETIALVLPEASKSQEESLTYWINYIRELNELEEVVKKERIVAAWIRMNPVERLVFNKLITGGFRVGVSQKLMVRALAQYTNIEEKVLSHRLMGAWSPDDTDFERLILSESDGEDESRPYPFYLAYALDGPPQELGDPGEWMAEYKWDGIRGQVVVRGGAVYIWSRGEELVTEKFPEYHLLKDLIPDGTVLDGEILPYKDGEILSFNLLQTRIGRKNLSKKVLEKAPVVFRCYDLLEWAGEDIREWPLRRRRVILEKLAMGLQENAVFQLSERLTYGSWEELAALREQSREVNAEGVMIKSLSGVYEVGRKRGGWWKWKVDPMVVDAVMIYAQRGHGRRANLYTDYTFAVWNDEGNLVPFAKAYSGLKDAEIKTLDAWIKKNTLERFWSGSCGKTDAGI